MSAGRRPIPGYTGHCPGLKFDVGHSYSWLVQHRPQVSRTHVGHVVVTPRGPDAQSAPVDVVDRGREVSNVSQAPPKPMSPRGGIAGYTGFVPGSRFVVGTNYRKASDDCFSDMERRSAERREREERARRSRSLGRPSAGRRAVHETGAAAPAAAPAMSNGAVSSALDAKFSRYAAHSKDEEPIPIPGYGGFVPRARTTQMGVGKRFGRFADEGFHALHDQVDRYRKSHARPISVRQQQVNGSSRS